MHGSSCIYILCILQYLVTSIKTVLSLAVCWLYPPSLKNWSDKFSDVSHFSCHYKNILSALYTEAKNYHVKLQGISVGTTTNKNPLESDLPDQLKCSVLQRCMSKLHGSGKLTCKCRCWSTLKCIDIFLDILDGCIWI